MRFFTYCEEEESFSFLSLFTYLSVCLVMDSGRLNVVKGLKRTNQIVDFGKS
jgi:hypothetical protein